MSWCDLIVLNVHVPTEDKGDDINDSFYEEIERLFDQLPMYHMKILLGESRTREYFSANNRDRKRTSR